MKQDSGNPYVGLRPFEVDESILFFGRNEQSLELLQRLHQHHFVAVVGSSGSGKSSLLRAGLIPALKAGYLIDDSDNWLIAIMKPGHDPLYNLTASLLLQADPNASDKDISALLQQTREQGTDALIQKILPAIKQQKNNFFLLVDQFEELFRFAMNQEEMSKQDEAIDFVNIMLELSRQQEIPFYVVITMRSDFIGDCARFYGLPEAMNQSQYLVPRLSRVQLKTVIEGPAQLYGSKVDTVLTSKLLNDLGKVKDELPLLQHALMRIWDFEMNINKSGIVDLEDYESIGGIEKALSNHADEALEGMNETDLLHTKKIFQALTTIDENGRKIRRPVLLSLLVELTGTNVQDILRIIQLFIQDKRSFLIISNAGETEDKIIDISHESLIRQWDTLNKWVDEEGESMAIYLQLSESAELYRQKKKDLLSGSELQIALSWYKKFKPVAAWAGRYSKDFNYQINYLLAGEKDWMTRQKKERGSKQKQRLLIIGLSVLFLFTLFITLGVVGLSDLNTELENERTVSKGYSLYLNAYIQTDKDPTVALRLAEEALLKNRSLSNENYAQYLYSSFSFYRNISLQDTGINSMVISRDGKRIILATETDKPVMYDTAGNKLQDFVGHTAEVYAVAFSPDGTRVLTASADGTARLWDLSGNTLQVFSGHKNEVYCAAFSPDGQMVITGGNDNTLRLWNIQTGKEISEPFRGHVGGVLSVCFSPDGKNILSGSIDSSAILWNINGRGIIQFRGHSTNIMSVAFSPDGKNILTGSLDGTAILWNRDAEQLQKVAPAFGIYSVAFSPDGKSFITGSADNRADLWNLDGYNLQTFISPIENERYGILSAAFTPDGSSIITASLDGSLRSWEVKSQVLQQFYDPSSAINAIAFSPDSKYILTSFGNNKAALWNLQGEKIREFEDSSQKLTALAFADQGEIIAAGFHDGTIKIWKLDGKLISTFRNQQKKINGLAFSPGGQTLLATYNEPIARLWDLHQATYKELKGHTKEITSAAFSKDGQTMVTGSLDSTLITWNMDGEKIRQVKNGASVATPVLAMALSPDSSYILTSGTDNKARLINEEGKVIQEFSGHTQVLTSVAFSPDGKNIVTGSLDESAIVWDLLGNPMQKLKLHNDAVLAVSFSPDGKTILTGSADKHAFLWKHLLPLSEFLGTNKLQPLSQEQREFYDLK